MRKVGIRARASKSHFVRRSRNAENQGDNGAEKTQSKNVKDITIEIEPVTPPHHQGRKAQRDPEDSQHFRPPGNSQFPPLVQALKHQGYCSQSNRSPQQKYDRKIIGEENPGQVPDSPSGKDGGAVLEL